MLSVVLPVFNAQKTIKKTITSILNSAKNYDIEIIIINDGSTDRTKKILEKYEGDSRFKIVHQNNLGVSAARNKGLKQLNSQSTYVAFIDDSDTISENYIESHLDILYRYPEINLSVSPIILEKNGIKMPQSLNFRFNINEDIVDIEKQPEFVQYHLGGTVFRTTVFTEINLKFAEGMNFWEDALLINSVVLKDKKYALVKKSTYYYDRNNESSLSHAAWSDESRYALHIKNSYFPLIEMSKNLYNITLPYIQFLIARHYLQYLLEHNQSSIIKYKNFVDREFDIWSKNLFQYIDVQTIDALECPINCKIYLYSLKDTELNMSEKRRQIKLLIQSIDLKRRKIIFTFSSEATGLDGDSKVIVNKVSEKPAEIVESKSRFLLGKIVQTDITLNKYSIPLNLKMIIKDFKVEIIDGTNHYEIVSASLFKRIIKKFKL